jgi:predicted Co/Zn/Cd cation transporter (cation efflux family)
VDTSAEQRVLRFSIAMTSVIGIGGITSGLATGSRAMVFDGMYCFVDVVLTLVSLRVSKLLAQESSRRFQYGYFHLEPLVAALGGSILAIACIYAIVNAVTALLAGGHVVAFRSAAVWATIIGVAGAGMAIYTARKARALSSTLLALDFRGWAITALLSLALLLSFALGALLQKTPLAPSIPYVDPLMLLIVALAVLPMPALTMLRAAREILQVAPDELDQQVNRIMSDLAARHGFDDYSSYVAKIGRMRFVDINVLVPAQYGITVSTADRIRSEVASHLEARWPQYWLNINFTADRRWM